MEHNVQTANKLIAEKSPYLLQHAYNPVDWHPWGVKALEKAKREDKPIFLSIGYSTCHWCHVMAEESFEDTEVARLMNETFVSIKVDREERPDIDSMYMTFCHMMTGSGGWPLTIIMTPEKKPFFAATYIPKESKFGRMGMLELIPKVKEIWELQQDKAELLGNKMIRALEHDAYDSEGEELDESVIDFAYKQLAESFDEQYGGFGTAPKFPTPHNLLFLLRYWRRTDNKKALEMTEKTLQAMQQGGIYDHLGFGFHRYSTDSYWLVPHFEKMLYDQAMLSIAYTEAYQATEKKEYKKTAEQIFNYILVTMSSRKGGFYSAEDADSEGEEGKFYLWKEEEIYQVLDQREADLISNAYNITKEGNFQDEFSRGRIGKNILHIRKPFTEVASDLNIPEPEFRTKVKSIRQKMYLAREKRIHPKKDDKILTSWNGLMIAALSKGAQVFNKPIYIEAAKQSADFIFRNMRDSDGRLFHRYRDGEAAIAAYLDDYVFLIWGLLELYEATFETSYLEKALELNDDLIAHYWDAKNGGFYFTADDDEYLYIRKKESYDGATPSGNSVALLNLLRLGRLTANSKLEEKAWKLGRIFSTKVKQLPLSHIYFMVALDFALSPSLEIVIAGNSNSEDTKEMINIIRKQYNPNKVLIFRPTDQETPPIINIARFSKDMQEVNGKPAAYICHNYTCQTPIIDTNSIIEILNEKTAYFRGCEKNSSSP